VKRTLYTVFLLIAVSAAPTLAGSNYKLKFDKFQNKKVASYDLTLGTECKLTQTLKSTLFACPFLAVSTEGNTPSLMLVSYAKGWDIMTYRSASPYSEGKAPAIITYKNGAKENKLLPAIYNGDVVRGGTVMETVVLRFGGENLSNIDNIEVKYGSNEYYFKFDDALTSKALKYEE
jgi:hypothetical protein